MPDRRTHRGPHPQDAELFAPVKISDLRLALADFSLLLTKGYADKSALKLVGDRFSLTDRQRLAIMRSACSDQQLNRRKRHRVELQDVAKRPVAVDGYNVLITVEAAMSGGVIFKGRDGCCRDLASIHGTYRKVSETIPALRLIGEFLSQVNSGPVRWLLDSPVSNSGRLKTLIGEMAGESNWDWEIELLQSPDAELKRTEAVVASSDSVVLDSCNNWVNLAAEIIKVKLPGAKVIDLAETIC